MVTVQRHIILVVSITLLLVVAVHGEPQYTATPAVSATAMPFGGTVVTDESQTPVTPLLAEANSVSGSNTGWAQATPGRLRASSAISNAPEGWQNSQGVCLFADHIRLDNPDMPNNTDGVFFFRFELTGTMRISANDLFSADKVQVSGATILGGVQAGQLTFRRIEGVPTLYAVSGGEGNPGDNILAGPGGEMRVYGSTTSVDGGYYEIHVGVPVMFIFQDMPINTSPPEDDWRNLIEVRMSAVAFSSASCDFSSTFEFSPQNPIIPDPDDPALPMTGWDMGAASGEILLPPPLTLATSTGSGLAAFVAGQGTISNLGALTLADFPEGLTGGNFADGWFEMEVALLEGQSLCDVAMTMPGAVGEEATWWFHDGAEWQSIALGDDDGDSLVLLQVTDNGLGDADLTVGVVALAGGVSDDLPLPSLPGVFQAAWRAGAVELSWQCPGVEPASLRLEAHLDGRTWLVPLLAEAEGVFTARDDAAALYGGGAVRYDLRLDGILLESRMVDLPKLVGASLDVIAPNPFNPSVEIAYTVAPGVGSVDLAIYDLQGRRVATLFSGDPGPGAHVAEWQGRDEGGRAVPSGVYLVRLATEQRVESQKISLVR